MEQQPNELDKRVAAHRYIYLKPNETEFFKRYICELQSLTKQAGDSVLKLADALQQCTNPPTSDDQYKLAKLQYDRNARQEQYNNLMREANIIFGNEQELEKFESIFNDVYTRVKNKKGDIHFVDGLQYEIDKLQKDFYNLVHSNATQTEKDTNRREWTLLMNLKYDVDKRLVQLDANDDYEYFKNLYYGVEQAPSDTQI